MPSKPPVPQLTALILAILGLSGLMVYLGLSIGDASRNVPSRRGVHATAVNFLCIDGWDELIGKPGNNLPALVAAIDNPTEATVDAALREMAKTSDAGGLQADGPGVWMMLVAVDPGLAKRFFRTMSLPYLTPIYEAHYGDGVVPEEWDIGELSYYLENTSSKEWAVRFGHFERQLNGYDTCDLDFPFQQGMLNMTNATWEANGTEDFADAILGQLSTTINSDLWLLTMAPNSFIMEPTYMPNEEARSAFVNGSFPTLGWPVLIEVHLIFGKVRFAVVRDTAGAVQYWTARNGSSSVNQQLAMNLTDAEASFLDEQVPLALVGGEDGGDVLFHSERLAQALSAPVLRADWLAFGWADNMQTGPQLHHLRYFWDSAARSANPAVGPRIGDEMAHNLMDGFDTRREVLQNDTRTGQSVQGTFGIDWDTVMTSVGCAQLPDHETSASYCGCPVQKPACVNMPRPWDVGQKLAKL